MMCSVQDIERWMQEAKEQTAKEQPSKEEADEEGSKNASKFQSSWSVERLKQAAREQNRIYLEQPPIWLMRSLVEMDDREPAISWLCEAMMEGRRVVIRRKEGRGLLNQTPIGRRIGALLDSLETLGCIIEHEGQQAEIAMAVTGQVKLDVANAVTGSRCVDSGMPMSYRESSDEKKAVGKNTRLICAQDLEWAAREGRRHVAVSRGDLLTPLARDRARELGIELRMEERNWV